MLRRQALFLIFCVAWLKSPSLPILLALKAVFLMLRPKSVYDKQFIHLLYKRPYLLKYSLTERLMETAALCQELCETLYELVIFTQELNFFFCCGLQIYLNKFQLVVFF